MNGNPWGALAVLVASLLGIIVGGALLWAFFLPVLY